MKPPLKDYSSTCDARLRRLAALEKRPSAPHIPYRTIEIMSVSFVKFVPYPRITSTPAPLALPLPSSISPPPLRQPSHTPPDGVDRPPNLPPRPIRQPAPSATATPTRAPRRLRRRRRRSRRKRRMRRAAPGSHSCSHPRFQLFRLALKVLQRVANGRPLWSRVVQFQPRFYRRSSRRRRC